MKLDHVKRLAACRAMQDKLYRSFRERRISGGEMESAMATLVPQLAEATEAHYIALEYA